MSNGRNRSNGRPGIDLRQLGAQFGISTDNQPKSQSTVNVISSRGDMPDRVFFNPYNFVPVRGDGCERSKPSKDSLTGSIHCTLVPKTDFFVPNSGYALEANAEEIDSRGTRLNKTCQHKFLDFFSYEAKDTGSGTPQEFYDDSGPERPVIPGSELRGMVRSMYEAFTDSCLSVFNDDKRMTARAPKPKDPGLLIFSNGEWTLHEAEASTILNVDNKADAINSFGINKRVSFSREWRTTELGRGRKFSRYVVTDMGRGEKSGYIKLGEIFAGKRHAHIFSLKGEAIRVSRSDLLEAINDYNSIITDYYRNLKVNKHGNTSTAYSGQEIPADPSDGCCRPVWYRKGGDKLYLSPACIGREMYKIKLSKLLGKYAPCTDNVSLCDACALFGMVGNEVGKSYGSRVRFSDARFTGNAPQYAEIVNLKELSTPSVTSMPMYTKYNGGGVGQFWNYDDIGVSLNGRKFYYHHSSDYSTKEVTKRNVTVRPMKGTEENRFEFDVFFERISENQLKKLLVVLSLLGNKSNHCYKLGMGKPIGLGSVKISVDKVMLRSIDTNTLEYSYEPSSKYDDLFTGNGNAAYINNICVLFRVRREHGSFNQLLSMTDFNHTNGYEVHYPVADTGNVYDWFRLNMVSIGNPRFQEILDNSGKLSVNSDPRRR